MLSDLEVAERRIDLPAPASLTPVLPDGAFAHLPQECAELVFGLGYVEEERLLSTVARVYDDAEGTVAVVAEGIPATTRILVRRPADPADFTGTVFLELMDAVHGYDLDEVWGSCSRHIVRSGHAWVGMTAGPVAADALRIVDPERYGAVSWARDPQFPAASVRSTDPGFEPTQVLDGAEEGLVWDLLTALSLRLRADDALLGRRAERVLGVGHGMAGVQLNTFANTLHAPYSELAGVQILDGYLNVAGGGIRRTLRQDSTMPGIASWRPARPPQVDVPHITVTPEADFVLYGSALLAKRADLRPTVRHVQVPGAPHRDIQYVRQPEAEAICRAGRTPGGQVDEASEVPLGTITEAMAVALDRWVADGTPAPESRWLTLDENGRVLRDDMGNALGGVRTGLADMPMGTTTGASAQHMDGTTEVMAAEVFAERYGSAQDFLTWFDIIENACLSEGYLTQFGVNQHRRVAQKLLARIGLN